MLEKDQSLFAIHKLNLISQQMSQNIIDELKT